MAAGQSTSTFAFCLGRSSC